MPGTYYISNGMLGNPLGNDSNPGTEALPFLTIERFRDQAVSDPGAWGNIFGGTYAERFDVATSGLDTNNRTTFAGGYSDSGETVIDSRAFNFGTQIFGGGGPGTQVEFLSFHDLTFGGDPVTYVGALTHCMNFVNASFIDTLRCNFYGSIGHGIHLQGFSDEGTHHCTFDFINCYKCARSGNGAGLRGGERTGGWCYEIDVRDSVFWGHAALLGAAGAETGTGVNFNSPTNQPDWPNGQDKSHDIRVTRCAMFNNGSSGASTQNPSQVTFEDLLIFGNCRIVPWASSSERIAWNGEGNGVRHLRSVDVTTQRCIIFDNRLTGIHHDDSVVTGKCWHNTCWSNAWDSHRGTPPDDSAWGGDYRREISSNTAFDCRNNIMAGANVGKASDAAYFGDPTDWNLISDGGFPGTEGVHSISGSPQFAAPPIDIHDFSTRPDGVAIPHWYKDVEYNSGTGNNAMDRPSYATLKAAADLMFALTPTSPCIDACLTIVGASPPQSGVAQDMGALESGDIPADDIDDHNLHRSIVAFSRRSMFGLAPFPVADTLPFDEPDLLHIIGLIRDIAPTSFDDVDDHNFHRCIVALSRRSMFGWGPVRWPVGDVIDSDVARKHLLGLVDEITIPIGAATVVPQIALLLRKMKLR